MAYLQSRQDLINYCKRRLGDGAIDINVTDDQIEDRINDAIQFNVDWNYNMVEKKYLSIKVQQSDIDNGYVTLPEDVLAVQRMIPFMGYLGNSVNYLFNVQYYLTSSALMQMYTSGDVSQFYLTKQYLSTMNDIFNNQPMYQFRRYTGKVYFSFDATQKLSVDDWLVFECYTPIDQSVNFWDDRLLKEYATALIKKQWATNLSKYQSIELPGGVKLNGTELYRQAEQEIIDAEDKIRKFSEPAEPIVG